MDTFNANKILVLGGTGHYGQYIVKSLIEKNIPTRVMSRNKNLAARILPVEVEIIEGDITSDQAIRLALTGVKGIIIAISALSPAQIRRIKEIEQDSVIKCLQEAEKMGIRRIIYLSVFEANKDFASRHRLAIASEKAEVEAWIRNSAFNWTIFGAPPSMEIYFAMIRGSRMMVPGGGPPALPTISPVDAGNILSEAILREDISGKRFKLLGPEAISFMEAARRISIVWKREIKFTKIPLILPTTAYYLTSPFVFLSDRILYIHFLLGFIRLLVHFPQIEPQELIRMHNELKTVFRYTPTTLEMEANNRLK